MTAVEGWLSRWGTWWLIACLVVAAGVATISGVSDQNGSAILIVIAVALVGRFILNRAQHIADTRSCPRCGERVAIGRLDCDSCGFDFDAR